MVDDLQMHLQMPSPKLKRSMRALYSLDPDFATIEAIAGPLKVRRGEPTFAALVRTIVGQQLSNKAATTIYGRLSLHIEVVPEILILQGDDELRSIGLSRAKIQTCKALAEALLSGQLSLNFSDRTSNVDIESSLTKIKGIGPWTAEIFMLFCLERLDVLPAADLAVQVAYQRLKQLPTRPSRLELIDRFSSLSPYRGTAAHLLWHSYRVLS